MNSDDIIELLQKRFLESGEILFNEAANYIHKLEMRHLGDSVAEVINPDCSLQSQQTVAYDHIVTYLRAFDNGYIGTHYKNCWHNHPVCALMIAADEIERLRAELDTLAKVIKRLNGDAVIYFRDEAVRGE